MSSTGDPDERIEDAAKKAAKALDSEALKSIERDLEGIIGHIPSRFEPEPCPDSVFDDKMTKCLALLWKIVSLLVNEDFGLQEIKIEIQDILQRLECDAGFDEIRAGIEEIERKLDEKDITGLDDIKAKLEGIEQRLDNRHTGLAEIKAEIEGIEERLDNRDSGLAEIKREIEGIEDALSDPITGLSNIESGIKGIEDILDNRNTGLAEIKREIEHISDELGDKNSGLAEIKREVEEIGYVLTNKSSGLAELRTAIENIEEKLDSPVSGLGEIMAALDEMGHKLDNPVSGLSDLRTEIHGVEERLDSLLPGAGGRLTTGPVVSDSRALSLLAKIQNSTTGNVAVSVTVFDAGTSPDPRTVAVSSGTAVIPPGCTKDFIFPKPPVEYEVQFTGIQTGVYAWTSTRTEAQGAPLSASNLIAANTFRHSQLSPAVSPQVDN